MQILSFFSFDNAILHEYEQMFPMVSQSVCIFLIWISLFPIYNCLGSHWFSCEVEFFTLFSHLVFEICIQPYVLLPFNEATYTNISSWLICSHHCTSVPITTNIVNITNKMQCDAGSKWIKVYSSLEKIQFPHYTIFLIEDFGWYSFFENSHCTNHMYTLCIC